MGMMDKEHLHGPITAQQVKDIKVLWADNAVQSAYERSSEFQLIDSAA
jgi:hypothetical protein